MVDWTIDSSIIMILGAGGLFIFYCLYGIFTVSYGFSHPFVYFGLRSVLVLLKKPEMDEYGVQLNSYLASCGNML